MADYCWNLIRNKLVKVKGTKKNRVFTDEIFAFKNPDIETLFIICR